MVFNGNLWASGNRRMAVGAFLGFILYAFSLFGSLTSRLHSDITCVIRTYNPKRKIEPCDL